MKAEDLIYEVDDEIEREKRNKAKKILKRQRKTCDNLQNQADKATEKYEEMLEMDVDDLNEEYGTPEVYVAGGTVNDITNFTIS